LTMKALVTTGDRSFQLQDVDIPIPGVGEILVKVIAVAQNPSDWKTLLLHENRGNVIGSDYAGIVAQIGPGVESGLRAIDERVAGTIHGGVGRNGAFAEYLLAPAELVISLPDTISFEEAAQLGTACMTACQSLYQALDLPSPLNPTSSPLEVLIWSGTSSTGQYAIQLAKLAGLRVISTASPKNFEFVKSVGADEVFDYADSWTARKIFAVTSGRLVYAVDCTSEAMTPNQVSMSLSTQGGKIATLLPYESRKKGVQTSFVLACTVFGKDVTLPFPFPGNLEHAKNAVDYCKMISNLLAQEKLKLNPIKLFPYGLQSVADGYKYMRLGKVHAEKITYRISDTPILAKTQLTAI